MFSNDHFCIKEDLKMDGFRNSMPFFLNKRIHKEIFKGYKFKLSVKNRLRLRISFLEYQIIEKLTRIHYS